jgi:hypothetical protein
LSHAKAGDLYLRMKKPAKQTKLPLHTDTIRHLVPADLGQVIGGALSTRPGTSFCPNPSGG